MKPTLIVVRGIRDEHETLIYSYLMFISHLIVKTDVRILKDMHYTKKQGFGKGPSFWLLDTNIRGVTRTYLELAYLG